MSLSDLAECYRLKWSVARQSLVIGGTAALLVLPWSRYGALVIGVGVACGVMNMLGIMQGSERLLKTRNPIFFGLSSLLRLGAFSIVAAALAVRGPWWSLGPFLAAFFLPLAAYALGASRVIRSKPTDL
jgi:hypothetical protein